MKRLRVYSDTSVLGGCFDEEFAFWSNGLMVAFRKGLYQPVLSEVTAAEVTMAPEAIRTLHAELLSLGADLIPVTTEALNLLRCYESHQVLGPRFRNDMLHIALATVADVDVLVSWNFTHIVRLDKIRMFNGIHLELGYKTLLIYSPREVMPYESPGADSSS